MIEAARKLAAEGLPVFPVNADKSPATANGFKDATTDKLPDEWRWDGIGVAVPDGMVVIDCDPRNGGSETLKMLRDSGRPLPRTRTARTRSGGFHYWLTVPSGIALRSTLGPGIDVKRAGKGYVIVPPSQGYVWMPGPDAPAEAPQWLLDELVVQERDGQAGEASEPKFWQRFEDGTAYGLRAMEGEIGRLVTAREGERNNALNAAAFALGQLAAGGELSEPHARDELMLAAERIGLSRSEAEGTIESGWHAGEQEPRQAPEREENPAPAAKPQDEARELWVDWEVDEPPLPFYLHPILPKNAYVLVYGATEASKSMVWNALCAEASNRGHRCTVYSLENPPATDRDRLRRLRPSRANFRLTNDPLDFNDPRQLEALVEREREWGADIVVIDTYSHAFNSRSEDGNAKAIDFARRVRYVMHEVGCSVVLIDHTGYAQTDEPRDASAKRQQVDVAVLMTKVGEWEKGKAARFQMTNKKAARFANPFTFTGEIRDVKHGDERGLALAWLGDQPRWEE